MRILVTGANGFVGQNLVCELQNRGFLEVDRCDIDTTSSELYDMTSRCDFIFHLAGVNRPKNDEEFMEGNGGFTEKLLSLLATHKNSCPVLMTSSVQAELDNAYGQSKKYAEDIVLAHAKVENAPVLIYRLPNLFGKWSKPNYNSVIATFCYNVTRDIPIEVHNPDAVYEFVYIDDLLNAFISHLTGQVQSGFHQVKVSYKKTIGSVAEHITSFYNNRKTNFVPDILDEFVKKLYSTYLSYLPEDAFSYPLCTHKDDRGSFTEFLKSDEGGQVSVNVIKPGIAKGNHWHHTKNEKFLVVSGSGEVRFRKINEDKVIVYPVSAEKMEVVDIPCGYTHSIVNTGDIDMVAVIWGNELFNPNNPDTHILEV